MTWVYDVPRTKVVARALEKSSRTTTRSSLSELALGAMVYAGTNHE